MAMGGTKVRDGNGGRVCVEVSSTRNFFEWLASHGDFF